ncbi:acetyl-CoA carboxylase biotin carboxylase subunit [Microcella alkalica]
MTLADDAVRIGPAPAQDSYLNQDTLIAAAMQMECDALHPGYGFLSENAGFAARVIEAGLIWIGPSPEVIDRMGDKAQARAFAVSCGVPVVPGSDVLNDLDEARAAALKIGYPVLLKAAEGGGGKGIRLITSESELELAYESAIREAQAAFGRASIYVEKALSDVRHIEVQILGDQHGNCIHLVERDCSLQRLRQKVVEEAPAPTLSDDTRAALHAYALDLAHAMSYSSAGTVEFLVDADGGVYFIEVNARVQVEHGITEMITGVDICVEQLRSAFGAPLSIDQASVAVRGHAIEVRVNAENPDFHFLGSPGEISYCRLPAGPGVRVDTFIETGVTIHPYYDSLIAKIMCIGADRDEAIRRLTRALDEAVIDGVVTTLPVTRQLVSQSWFAEADYATHTLEKNLSTLL